MSAPRLLEGRVALVTGGARGIGLAVCRDFVAHGAQVMVVDSGTSIPGEGIDPSVVEAAVASLGESASGLCVDLGEPGQGEAAVAAARQHFGAVDIVVNNAAVLRDAFVFRLRRADWQRVLEVNLMAPMEILGAASALMRDQGREGRAPGRIVNVVSTAGLVGNLGQAAYASAKAGLVGLTRVAAMDLARAGIGCNAVAPFAATRVTESIRPANDAQASYKARALGIPAGHVARLASFLASSANGFTGQVFGVRAREVFLFSRPEVRVRLAAETPDRQGPLALGGQMEAAFAGQLADLVTDLELFDTEPLL